MASQWPPGGAGGSSHDVNWYGDFRGTEWDPREVGWCETCGREVYYGDPAGHGAAAYGAQGRT